MNIKKKFLHIPVAYPKTVVISTVLLTVLFGLFIPRIQVDTDPENMLSPNEPVRLAHHAIKEEFKLYDVIVLGIVDETSDNGVFTPERLRQIAAITDEIVTIDGVIIRDVISPTTTDDIQVRDGVLRIERLLQKVDLTDEEARQVRDAALDNPVLRDMLVSGDGKAMALYIPIQSKDMSYRVSNAIRDILNNYPGIGSYHITGLPLAEDTFGYEMFRQMSESAPLAALIILLLMFFFFRKLSLVLAPMILAVMSVVWTMGLLIGNGFTVHIMSSMIPIFLMPIAVVNSIHILSEFFNKYQTIKNRRAGILVVMDELFTPMLFTSITSMIGFASLALTPIPPVRVFGLFVAFGIAAAWFLTMTFLPAYIMLLKEESLKNFGEAKGKRSPLEKALFSLGRFTVQRYKLVLIVTAAVLVVSAVGISRIVINDNPVKWFQKGHDIRIADRVLNDHFGGTYMAYFVLEAKDADAFKQPLMMVYIEKLQEYIEGLPLVGKTTSLADIVKKISYELHDEDETYSVIPDKADAIGQYLFLYEMSGDPDDLYHLVNYDYNKVNMWVHLKSGDNRDMSAVERDIRIWMADNPPPENLQVQWGGLTYLNVAWQDKMVKGMLYSLAGCYVIVFIVMIILFQSFLWGVLSMIPLTTTIAFIYGLIGFAGKDYDMPVAILSSLTLGLSIDFAIHFLQRSRQIYKEVKDWRETARLMFGDPGRAIARNAIVIAIGFIPLLIAPLVPYQTVGFFLVAIMIVSGLGTMIILPSLVTMLQKRLFKGGAR